MKRVNSCARRFFAFERDDKEWGVAGALKIIFIDEAEELMRTGKLRDAKTLIALQAYLLEQGK